MFDHFLGGIEPVINKIVIEPCMLFMKEIQDALQISGEPDEIAKPLAEARVTAIDYGLFISKALRFTAEKENLADLVFGLLSVVPNRKIEQLIP